MTAELAPIERPTGGEMTREQVELVKRTIAKGATDDELKLFIATANRLGLDPFARQIFSIQRWDPDRQEMGLTTHVSIDGLRLVAERTRRYMPAEDLPDFRYDDKGHLVAAVVTVKKLGPDSVWHKVPAIAFFSEYAQCKKGGALTKNWAEKPHIMLSKCAEALAIRRAFPMETSGAYVPEEFGEAAPAEVMVRQEVAEPPAAPDDHEHGEDEAAEQQARQAVILEIKNELLRRVPGTTPKDKQAKAGILHVTFGTGSWIAAENLPLGQLQQGLKRLQDESDPPANSEEAQGA